MTKSIITSWHGNHWVEYRIPDWYIIAGMCFMSCSILNVKCITLVKLFTNQWLSWSPILIIIYVGGLIYYICFEFSTLIGLSEVVYSDSHTYHLWLGTDRMQSSFQSTTCVLSWVTSATTAFCFGCGDPPNQWHVTTVSVSQLPGWGTLWRLAGWHYLPMYSITIHYVMETSGFVYR